MLPKHSLAMRHEDRVCLDRWEGEVMPYRYQPANSLLFLPGGSSFQSSLENRPYSGTVIVIDDALFSRVAADHIDFSRIDFVCRDASNGVVLSLMQTIRQFTVADDMASWPILVESASISLAVALIRVMSPDASTALRQAAPGLGAERKRRVVDFVEANLHRPFTIAEMADVAAMSPFHFVRSFKKAVGETPLRYVVRRRLDLAQRVLRTSNAPLADVALQVGYASQSHMTTVFKKVLGVSPGRYRKGVAGAVAAWFAEWCEALGMVAAVV